MKKFFLIIILAALCLSLCSCMVEVHWFEHSTYLPWYVVWIPAIIITVIILAVAHNIIISKTYKCPKCGQVFSPKRFEISAWMHCGTARLMRCPKCGHKGFCEIHRD